MKAVQMTTYGNSDVLKMNDIPKPSLKQKQVLVEVHAVSINPFDSQLRLGNLQKMITLSFPSTVGGDFAGEIVEIGPEIEGFETADKVYGQAIVLNGSSGAFAQFASVNVANIAKKPVNVSFINASGLPLVGSSAIQALEDHIKLEKNQKILIHGGAGGIGHVAIQLAKAKGAYVATTVGTKDIAFVKELGADEIIDYKTEKFEEMLKNCDAVYDLVGGETTNKSFQVLKKGGVIVSMRGKPNKELAEKFAVIAIGQSTQTNTDHLNRLTKLVESGKITIEIEKIFSFNQVKEAFDYAENIHSRGKVVLTIKE